MGGAGAVAGADSLSTGTEGVAMMDLTRGEKSQGNQGIKERMGTLGGAFDAVVGAIVVHCLQGM